MGDRIDEIKGNVKDAVGDLTDNEQASRSVRATMTIGRSWRCPWRGWMA